MRRKLFFVYGVGCHALFLAIYAWMAAFVGDFGFGLIPTIDGPQRGSLAASIGIDLSLIAIFGIQHSVMARPTFKRWWTRFIPEPIERSTYVLVSCLVSFLLMWQWRPLGGMVWDVSHPLGRTALHALFALGWLLVPAVSLLINHFDLFGTRQVWLYLKGDEYTNLPFRTPLAYRVVRHPLYIGWMIAFWATPTMTYTHLFFAALMTVYILIAIPFEERNLVEHFGPTYEHYRRRVGGLVPRFYPPPSFRFDLSVLRSVTWWSWVVIIAVLVAHFVTRRDDVIYAAIAFVAALGCWDLMARRGDLAPLGFQIRFSAALVLVAGLLPGMEWILVALLVGTIARVLTGYCLLERTLRMMSWNRVEPLTLSRAWQILMARPTFGGLFVFGHAVGPPTASPCDIPSRRTARSLARLAVGTEVG